MDDYVIGIDSWEGHLEIDEQVIWDGGVRFMMIRLNDINGVHHKDKMFDQQWREADRFERWPYFVYSPWNTGVENYDWMMRNLPADAFRVTPDIEVRRTGYSPAVYGREVGDFVSRLKIDFEIYTGGGFTEILTPWPKVKYMWARYPYLFYPSQGETITWEELHRRIRLVSWSPGTRIPGPCSLWQISGDRLKLPGLGGKAVDIIVFNGGEQQLNEYLSAGKPKPVPAVPVAQWAHEVDAWARQQGYTGPRPVG